MKKTIAIGLTLIIGCTTETPNDQVIPSHRIVSIARTKGLTSIKSLSSSVQLAYLDSVGAMNLAFLEIDSGLSYSTVYLAQMIRNKKLGENLLKYFENLPHDLDSLRNYSRGKIGYDLELIKALIYQKPLNLEEVLLKEIRIWDSLKTTKGTSENISDEIDTYYSSIVGALYKLNSPGFDSINVTQLLSSSDESERFFFNLNTLTYTIPNLNDTLVLKKQFKEFTDLLRDSLTLIEGLRGNPTHPLSESISYPIIYNQKKAIVGVRGRFYKMAYLLEMIAPNQIRYAVISSRIF